MNTTIIGFITHAARSFAVFLGLAFVLSARAAPQDPIDQQLSRILEQIQSGDLRDARAGLIQALAQSPGDPRIFNLLGVVEAQENNFTAAQADFEKAIKAAPRFSGPYINLGRLYQEHSNEPHALENARTTYTKLLAFEPANVEANYQAAVVEHRLGLFTQSLQHLSRLPADTQGRSPALALRCADLTGLGRLAEAQKTAKQLAATQDLAETDVVSIVPALIEHHSEETALNLLQSLASRGLASPHSLHRLAALAEARGQFQQARDALEKDLQSEAPGVPVLTQLARISYRAHDLDGALGYLARARDLAPENAAVHFFFGVICIEQKLPPEAKKSLSEAVRLDPTNPYYNYALGAVLVGQKNPDEAIAYFRKYVKSKPEDPRGRFALGVAYYEASQPDLARQEFAAIAGRPETRFGTELYLSRLDIDNEQLDEALKHLKNALAANPLAPDGYAESGLVHIRRNEFAAAEKDLEHAVKLAPDHYLSNLRLLMLYQRTKDPRTAAQSERVDQLRKAGEQKEVLLMRSLEIRPY